MRRYDPVMPVVSRHRLRVVVAAAGLAIAGLPAAALVGAVLSGGSLRAQEPAAAIRVERDVHYATSGSTGDMRVLDVTYAEGRIDAPEPPEAT